MKLFEVDGITFDEEDHSETKEWCDDEFTMVVIALLVFGFLVIRFIQVHYQMFIYCLASVCPRRL